MARLATFISSLLLLLGAVSASVTHTNPANKTSSSKRILTALLHGKGASGSLVEAKHKTHTGAHTGFQVRIAMGQGTPENHQAGFQIGGDSGLPSDRVAGRNTNQELAQAISNNVEVVIVTCITFMGGAFMALIIAYCLWGGDAPTSKGLPPLHGRGGFPYIAAFPKPEIKTNQTTVANIPYDLGNVYTGSKQHHMNVYPGNFDAKFVSAHPQSIPPISTTRY